MSDKANAECRIRNADLDRMANAECGLRSEEVQASVSVERLDKAEDAGSSVHGRLNDNIERLACLLERINMGEYIVLLQNTRRLIFINFTCGLARGFGMILGMTALAAVFLIVLSKIAALPFVPGYIAKFIIAIQSQMSK